MGRSITIAGGGLAGLTLGILLRQEQVPVEIWDAGTYPRHRVCGEFISGRGVALLERLGLNDSIQPLGCRGRTVRFYTSGRRSRMLRLPRPALSISRADLDNLLASEFRRLGGILYEERRWTGAFTEPGLVRATGRKLHPRRGKARQLFGIKMHVKNLPLETDLELHFSRLGYAGLSKLPGGQVNICALLASHAGGQDLRGNYREMFAQLLSGPTRMALLDADLQPDSCAAVAGISLKRETARGTDECRIGDSICMIPPLTGNGMSIAVESAYAATPWLARYSRGEQEWPLVQRQISQECDRRFTRRLIASSILQKLTHSAGARALMLLFLNGAPASFRVGFHATR